MEEEDEFFDAESGDEVEMHCPDTAAVPLLSHGKVSESKAAVTEQVAPLPSANVLVEEPDGPPRPPTPTLYSVFAIFI